MIYSDEINLIKSKMFEQPVSVIWWKKRCVENKREGDFTKGNIRHVICRRYLRSKIHAV
jgi:hypothetical protein